MSASKRVTLPMGKLHYSKVLGIIAVVCVAFALVYTSPLAAADDGARWSMSPPPSFEFDTSKIGVYTPPECQTEKVTLGDGITRADVCMVMNESWRLGKYSYIGSSGSQFRGMAVGFSGDTRMYKLFQISEMEIGSTNIAVIPRASNRFSSLNFYRNFPSKLTKVHEWGETTYRLNAAQPDYTLQWSNGNPIQIRTNGMVTSPNRKWLVAEMFEKGILLVNLETLEARRISALNVPYNPSREQYPQFAVSNDGRYVAALGPNFPSTVISVTDECGDMLGREMLQGAPLERPCQEFSLSDYFADKIPLFTFGQHPVLNHDATELRFLSHTSDNISRWVILRAAKFDISMQIDYLALGDSYSSGEGDTAKNPATGEKYYLPFTDATGSATVPTEKCHISSRSYPFVLGKAMGLSDDKIKSVACSGARVKEDYAKSNSGYDGQGGRLGVLESESLKQAYKTTALNEFIPGRNQQIEFVRKYQPKAITLTGGGNDAGFGDIVKACAIPGIKRPGSSSSCWYASTNEGRSRIGNAIRNQYTSLARLYNELHRASPNTRIYVLGYPQFFSAGGITCAPNVRFNQEERIMARAAVQYLNSVIKAAAKSSGVAYIDIENSLGGHILCGEQESYVTGLASSGRITLNLSELFSQESFHPNAKGHQSIANVIQSTLGSQKLDEYNYCSRPYQTICPDSSVSEADIPVPSFFAEAMGVDTTNYVRDDIANKSIFQKGIDILLLGIDGLAPNSLLRATIFSDPIDLGEYTTDAEGNLTASITILANLPAGAHTLQVEGETFSGEPITLWQTILIVGKDGDLDEDGVPDSQQACLFVSNSGIDVDGDGVDDACDGEIGLAKDSTPELKPEPAVVKVLKKIVALVISILKKILKV